ncbi:MAG: NUDIX domain-containing protein [Myxococcota bacterium]|nr:NUDIX hydrolase [Myxococcota bacterium]
MASELVSRRAIYKGRTIKVSVDTVRLPNGKVLDLDYVEHPGAAAIVPMHEDQTVTLIRQYRYSAGGEWIIEIPAGKLDHGEAPEICASRELVEEVGLRAGTLQPLGFIYATPGFCNERIYLFLATNLVDVGQQLEEDELLEVKRVPFREAVRMAVNGEISDAKSATALLRAAAMLGISVV